jgi:hypoxanthine phosphoribosyltransferase
MSAQVLDPKMCFITILKGGIYTTSKLKENMYFLFEEDAIFGYMGLSSYKDGTESREKVEVTYPLDLDPELLKDRTIWLVDDIMDTGLTLFTAKQMIRDVCPTAVIRTAVLINKPDAHLPELGQNEPDVVGFVYHGDKFLVGCGLGLGEKLRWTNALFEIEE